MGRYLARRGGQALIVLWAAYTVSFLVLYALPGDAVDARLGADPGSDITPAQVDALRADYGLDKPLLLQYLTQLGRAVTGDLGRSFGSGTPVSELIVDGLPSTAAIAGTALVLALIFGGGLALLATGTSSRRLSRFLLNLPPLGVAVPGFWIGLLLLDQFSFRIHWFPALGNAGISSVVLPSITLAIPTAAMIAQLLAKSLHHSLSEPWADTARAKGASAARVLLRHALRNAVLPSLTVAGLLAGQLLSGSVVAETVFSRNGLGRLTASAVSAQDTLVVQGLVLFGALLFVLVNLGVDLLYPVLDRRILAYSAAVKVG